MQSQVQQVAVLLASAVKSADVLTYGHASPGNVTVNDAAALKERSQRTPRPGNQKLHSICISPLIVDMCATVHYT